MHKLLFVHWIAIVGRNIIIVFNVCILRYLFIEGDTAKTIQTLQISNEWPYLCAYTLSLLGTLALITKVAGILLVSLKAPRFQFPKP